MNREVKICDECESQYFSDTSQMAKLCPECSHYLYGYENCIHVFENGRCTKCNWNGNTTKFITKLKCKKQTFAENINWLSLKSIEDKNLFNKLFLFELTIMNRAIWDDPTTSETVKIECLKWSNELSHRLWNLQFELEKGIDEFDKILSENITFYQQQSKELAEHLASSFQSAIDKFVWY